MMRRASFLREILRLCLSGPAEADADARLSRLTMGRDLSGLSDVAYEHGVAGYVHQRLKDIPGINADALQELRTLHEHAVRTHLRALGDLARIASITDADWTIVHGPIIAEGVHGRPGLRTYDALDIVIQDSAFPAFLDQLLGLGGRLVDSDSPSPGDQSQLATVALPYGSIARLHRRVPSGIIGRALDQRFSDVLLARTQVLSLEGVPVRTLAWDDALLLLAFPASADAAPFGWLKDIERVIATGSPRWEYLTTWAWTLGCAGILRKALHSASTALAAEVPDAIMAALSLRVAVHRPFAEGVSNPRRWSHLQAGDAPATLLLLTRREARVVPTLPPVEWENVLALAIRERVAPLVFDAIRSSPDGGVPASIRAVLTLAYDRSRAQTDVAYRELAQALHFLRERGCLPMLLKGVALGRFTYVDPALRPFNDLDLLVQFPEVELAHRGLRQAGYTVAGEMPTRADMIWRHGRGYYDPEAQRMSVDLHWRYAGYPLGLTLDYAGIFRRAQEVRIDGEAALLPSSADMVVAVGVSFLRELWYQKPKFRYLRDLTEIVGRHPVDWDTVLRVATETPLVRSPVYLALAAAVDVLGAPIPQDVLETLASRRWQIIGRRLRRHIAQKVLRQDRLVETILQVTLMRWMDGDSVREFLQWVRSLVFVPTPLASSKDRWRQRLRER